MAAGYGSPLSFGANGGSAGLSLRVIAQDGGTTVQLGSRSEDLRKPGRADVVYAQVRARIGARLTCRGR